MQESPQAKQQGEDEKTHEDLINMKKGKGWEVKGGDHGRKILERKKFRRGTLIEQTSRTILKFRVGAEEENCLNGTKTMGVTSRRTVG